MKTSIKTSLIIVALALLACIAGLVWLASRPDELDEPVAVRVADPSRGPSFAVRVVMPRAGLPLGGILPDWIVKKLDGTPSELRFDNTASGAKSGSVEHDRLELTADSWDLFIETDGEERVVSGTRLVFPLTLGGRHVRLSCRPADHTSGYLRTTTESGTDKLSGRFLVKLARCENAESGKAVEWPPAPLTVRGNFEGLPQHRR